MKKVTYLLAVLFLAFAVASCNNTAGEGDEENQDSTQVESQDVPVQTNQAQGEVAPTGDVKKNEEVDDEKTKKVINNATPVEQEKKNPERQTETPKEDEKVKGSKKSLDVINRSKSVSEKETDMKKSKERK